EVWQKRSVVLDDKLPLGDTVRLRFIVSNDNTNYTVEAGIDNVELTTLTVGCTEVRSAGIAPIPEQTSGCEFSRTTSARPFGLLAIALLLFGAMLIRRRA